MYNKLKQTALVFGVALLGLTACAPKQPQTANQPSTPATPAQAGTTAASGTPTAAKSAPESPYSSDKAVIAQGQSLFQSNCTACHSFKQKGIGPNLSGVTTKTSHAWLTKFIPNAPAVIQSGDARAKALFEEYKQMMPPFSQLSEADVQALVSYLNTHKADPNFDPTAEGLGEALPDPIPTKITKSGLRLVLDEVLTAPATADKIPYTRINKMRVLSGPGKKDRHFIQELRGVIYEMEGNKLKTFMDITKERPGFIPQPGHATGFGSFAFHPEFYKNGLFYTTHTEKANAAPADFAYADSLRVSLQWVLTEWKATDPNAATFSGTGREMWRMNMMIQIHGVQEISFNPLAKPGHPDYGLLFIGIGDGGSAEQGAYSICNSNKTIWSSIIRIDPKGRNSKNGKYGIPASNPYASDNDPKTLGEIYARGFRNPNRYTWAADGTLLASDIGLNNIEELNIIKPGADYGWPAREGTYLLNYKGKMNRVYALPKDESKNKYTYPVAQFDHDEGNAFSGGFVYNGSVPALKGKYIFGDIVTGRVFYVDYNKLKLGLQTDIKEFDLEVAGKEINFQDITKNQKTDLRFGLGPKNELYIFTKTDGRIYKVTGLISDKKV